jgi:hypothetical protein
MSNMMGDLIKYFVAFSEYQNFTLSKHPINQFELVYKSRYQRLRAYCSNIYTVRALIFFTPNLLSQFRRV